MVGRVNILIKPSADGYEAWVQGQAYKGTSPDEALGCAIRELDLTGYFDEPVRLSIEKQE